MTVPLTCWRLWWVAATILLLAPSITSVSYASKLDQLRAAATDLGISPPDQIIWQKSVSKQLDVLSRERCDRQAISELATALADEGYRREAAEALVKFSSNCGGHEEGIRQAVNLLLDLSDYSRAIEVSNKLIEMEPNNDNGYFLRAVAFEKSNKCEQAIADYSTSLELFGDKDQISSVAYESISRCYEQLGQYCDAILPIENWVALNPADHDNDQTRSILRRLGSKGQCVEETKGKKEEVFRRKGAQVINLKASINGVSGTFILDTGATYVTVKQTFASKAGIKLDGEKIRISTANGFVDAILTKATKVQLQSLEAQQVQMAIQTDDYADFGDGVDGLIGMSFLSRYEISMDAKSVRIKPRKEW